MNQDKFTEIFVEVDDFCQNFKNIISQSRKLASNGEKKCRNRESRLSDAEVITILIGFHLGAHKCFKHYYLQVVCQHYKLLFPDIVGS